MFYYYMPYDSNYGIFLILLLIALGIGVFAQNLVNNRYATYKRVATRNGMSGSEAARQVLDANGLVGVGIECISGKLTDHYDPRTNVVRLSQAVYEGRDVASVGIACHEVGHAIQYNTNYALIHIRAAIVPITNFGAAVSPYMILIGLLISRLQVLAWIGLIFYSFSAIFQLITLPVELNASSRAMKTIREMNLLASEGEYDGAAKVLKAAALTYVASLATSLVYLLRMVMMVVGNTRNDE